MILDVLQAKLDAPAIFDNDFQQAFERQLNVHFQLLVQNLALSGEIKDADQVWVTTLKMMVMNPSKARCSSTCRSA